MKIACNECRQRLSDALDETANTAAPSALTEHLATCDSCRAELELLRAARAQLHDFPILAAPADLRARVRAQLEAAPVVPARATSPAAKTKTGAAMTSIEAASGTAPRNVWRKPEPRRRQSWIESLRAFLRNPTNITWVSCCVLLLFYFVSLSRQPKPTGQFKNIKQAPIGEPYQKRFDTNNGGDIPAYQSPYRNKPFFKPMPKLSEPGKPPNWPPPDLPAGALPSTEQKPLGKTPPVKPVPSKPKQSSAASGKKSQESAPPVKPAPKSSAPAITSDSNAPNAATTRSGQTAQARDAAGNRKAAPPAPASQTAKKNYLARSTPGGAAGPAGSAATITANGAQKSDEDSATIREIKTQFTPPRDVGWAQISVVLSGGARFADGQKSHIIWRGAAAANEPIDLSFSVQNAPHSGDAKITLQEMKNGQAQTIAYKTIAIGASE